MGGGPNGGYLQNEEDSGITVSFEFADGVVLSESAKIEWNVGDLRIVDVTEESAKIKLFERDMNLNPESIDTINIEVFSENDIAVKNFENFLYFLIKLIEIVKTAGFSPKTA